MASVAAQDFNYAGPVYPSASKQHLQSVKFLAEIYPQIWQKLKVEGKTRGGIAQKSKNKFRLLPLSTGQL